MKQLQRISACMAKGENLAKFVIFTISLILIFGIPTSLIPNPIFHRMTPSTPLDYFFLLTTSFLGGLYFAIPASACPHDAKAAGGGILGLLAFACPVCDKLLVLLLGTTFLMAYFDPLRPILGAISILVLLIAINGKLQAKANGGK